MKKPLHLGLCPRGHRLYIVYNPQCTAYHAISITLFCIFLDEDAVFNVKNVYNYTDDVVDWSGLGIQLGVKPARLKKIRLENKTEDESRSDMIRIWMHGDPEASWQKLSVALERVDHRVLAKNVHSQVLPLLEHGPLPAMGTQIATILVSRIACLGRA